MAEFVEVMNQAKGYARRMAACALATIAHWIMGNLAD